MGITVFLRFSENPAGSKKIFRFSRKIIFRVKKKCFNWFLREVTYRLS